MRVSKPRSSVPEADALTTMPARLSSWAELVHFRGVSHPTARDNRDQSFHELPSQRNLPDLSLHLYENYQDLSGFVQEV